MSVPQTAPPLLRALQQAAGVTLGLLGTRLEFQRWENTPNPRARTDTWAKAGQPVRVRASYFRESSTTKEGVVVEMDVLHFEIVRSLAGVVDEHWRVKLEDGQVRKLSAVLSDDGTYYEAKWSAAG